MTTSTLPKSRQQLILAVLMVCSLLIWLDNTVLSTTLETLADPVRGLTAGGAPEPARDGGPTADETAPRAGAEDLTAREGADVGTR
ncbi:MULTISPECIES: hypothetical protein [Pseudofrankia]|uniref:hypothetical protein n=1 Tax=Pseudofrankia TaxID=2994363 RepID=UPI000234C72C|nr:MULTISPECIES: hypothetical protein [Pseudofrankia]OHV40216.1 hypothetical protein BCD49_39755 [Pseudofrankia sp. EUN1h]